jgi:predicted DNA-binding transcriptional regulator AlpA
MVTSEKLLTRQQAAELLGLRPQTLAAWALTGKNLPVVKLGEKAVRYRLSDVQAFIDKSVVPAGK